MIEGLPREILVLIFAKLPHRDLLQFLLVDKTFSAEVRLDVYRRLSFFVIFYSKEPLWGQLKNTKKQVLDPSFTATFARC
jgi:hypothetical protein